MIDIDHEDTLKKMPNSSEKSPAENKCTMSSFEEQFKRSTNVATLIIWFAAGHIITLAVGCFLDICYNLALYSTAWMMINFHLLCLWKVLKISD